MYGIALLMLQAAAVAPPVPIDLTRPVATAGCTTAKGDEIVVCGGRENPYRLPPPDARFEETARIKAETALFGGRATGAVETEAVTMPGGMQSNRMMARIRLPF